MKKGLFKFSIHDITEIAVLCALAVVLDRFVRIPLGATGGSINIALVPIFIIGLRHGWFKCFIAGGIIFGLLTCLLDGYGIVTYPLEYLVAFGSICIVGVFARYIFKEYTKNKEGVVTSILTIIFCCIIWFIIRLFAGTIDSIILYDYEFIPALVYNVSYVGISAIADCIIISCLLPLIIILNKRFPTSFTKTF